jgi:hypothetical protein
LFVIDVSELLVSPILKVKGQTVQKEIIFACIQRDSWKLRVSDTAVEFDFPPNYFTTIQINVSQLHRRLPPFLMFRAHVIFKHLLPFYTFKRKLFLYLHRLLVFSVRWRFSFLVEIVAMSKFEAIKFLRLRACAFTQVSLLLLGMHHPYPPSWIMKRMPVE